MKSVLLVEDDKRFRDTLRASFEGLGYQVFAIASEREYFSLKVKSIDYAVLDLQLEKGSSLSIIPLIKRYHSDCRILMLTGFGTVTAAVQAIKLGADNFIHKPATLSRILSALDEDISNLDDIPQETPTLARQERDYIEFVLARCDGNISKAARELGIHRQSLQRKLRSYPPLR
ncbi:response regulator transcription factor [Pseudobacteriovorax antillogorgiicola]|uniref:Two-component system, response regulator RegA n=1 Tax=Pseudobacteriovorax antillogorgiicola TaxID=1513793 RepID=A0A1Y6BXZ8_9BACT|nr:response regulator [Pseudobacteriovorax antillogorgiicola]TCS53118.1 two-component system response regulator RegA [Pseudobacteriovorax antillogorgiicola]SMF25497.1 two-component system, response regulator RegA [Pseudobacteriovorax antillogorgiicola]